MLPAEPASITNSPTPATQSHVGVFLGPKCHGGARVLTLDNRALRQADARVLPQGIGFCVSASCNMCLNLLDKTAL